MDFSSYSTLRNKFPLISVSLGYMTVTLFSENELAGGQVGYSLSANGEPFIGEDGDWKTSWLVIGYEDLCGDPIIVDLANSEFPVFMAAHGEGVWSAEMIASSFRGFVQTLDMVQELSVGRESPVKLEQNPVSEAERDRVLRRIGEFDGNISVEFWKNWIQY